MPRKIKGIGLRHYGAKTIDLTHAVDWEFVITEIFVGFLLGVFSYMGYVGGIALLFILCLIGSFVCFYAVIRNIVLYFKYKSANEKSGGQKS